MGKKYKDREKHFDNLIDNSREKEGIFMNSWFYWIAIIAFLIFCCGPMLFMRRRRKRGHDTARKEDRKQPDDRG